MHEDLRAELIKQFSSEVVERKDSEGRDYYACPSCKRAVAVGSEKCQGCGQNLSWKNIHHENEVKGTKMAKIEFEVPADFSLNDCRKCPLSYIGRNGDESVYECPLQMHGKCSLILSE